MMQLMQRSYACRANHHAPARALWRCLSLPVPPIHTLQVCQWVFGQEFPGPDAPLGQQVLSVGTAVIGLAAFAMVLALVEQVVLEGLEANVKRGSKVFESGHVSD